MSFTMQSMRECRVSENEVDLLLELPLPVVKGTDLSSLQPARDAVEVERMLNTQHIHAEHMLHSRMYGLQCVRLVARQ